MPHCYILHSEKVKKFYIGACHGSILSRIEKHNNKGYGNHRYTAIANDWELYLEIETEDYSQAIRIERKIKSMKSKVYIQNLKRYPEMIEKILIQTSRNIERKE